MLSLCIIIEERKYKKKKVKPQVCRSMWLCLIPHSCWKLSSGDSEADLKLILAPQREVVLLEFDFFFFKCVTYIRRIKVCLCKCDGSSVVLLKYSAIVYKHSCWAAVALDHLLAAFSIHGRQPVVSFRWRLCCYPTVPQKREHEIVWRKDLHQASPLILTNIAVISLEKKNKSLYNNTINWLDMILHWIQKVMMRDALGYSETMLIVMFCFFPFCAMETEIYLWKSTNSITPPIWSSPNLQLAG